MTQKHYRAKKLTCMGYDLIASPYEPYYFIGFAKAPEIEERDILLESGDTLKAGDTIAYLGSGKTSAGFNNIHLVSPALLRYVGVAKGDNEEFILWEECFNGEARVLSHDDYASLYYGHNLEEVNGNAVLLFTNSSGAGRVVETKIMFRKHDEVSV